MRIRIYRRRYVPQLGISETKDTGIRCLVSGEWAIPDAIDKIAYTCGGDPASFVAVIEQEATQ